MGEATTCPLSQWPISYLRLLRSSNLTTWAENGVLLLNTALTVRAGDAGSHSKQGWEEFTDKVVDVVDRYGGANLGSKMSTAAGRGRGIVFLAWGAWAAKRVAKLDKVRAPPCATSLLDRPTQLVSYTALSCRRNTSFSQVL